VPIRRRSTGYVELLTGAVARRTARRSAVARRDPSRHRRSGRGARGWRACRRVGARRDGEAHRQGARARRECVQPGRIYVGGEITAVWELLEGPIRDAVAEGTITDRARATPIVPDSAPAEYRLRGAVALVTAPGYAALAVG
jgi:hypothetical protein